jgi:hypothetical protein
MEIVIGLWLDIRCSDWEESLILNRLLGIGLKRWRDMYACYGRVL